MLGRTISHFGVERRLGAGGMGTVFLARDLALGRPVALKVVGGDVHATFRRHLLKEAEASARLQHPAIATFYEAGEEGDLAFIAMEYVAGQTLRERLGSGAVPVHEVLPLGAALLEALHHAHLAGLLHRDIKPENVMLTPAGTPKLLDFGLARAFGEEAVTRTVVTAGVAGTIGYMSPEQINGDTLDARSDLFAVAALLYELIAGRPAFPGETPGARIGAILGRDPAALPPAIPGGIDGVLRRALARNRDQRFPSAAAFLSEWRRLGESPVTESPLPQTLAVFDMRNLSSQPGDEWIGSGIAESLSADLSRVAGLVVVSRDKLLGEWRRRGGDAAATPLDTAAALGCRWALAGSFQRLGPAIRMTATLSDVATGQVLSAEKMDGTVDGLFDLQDRLSNAVRAGLHLRLPSGPSTPPGAPDVQAFECYARGRRLWQRLEKGTFDQAHDLYMRAIAVQPDYAPALSGLAALHAMRFTFTTDSMELEHAAMYARRAIQSDPTLADPHIWLGYALFRQDRHDEALESELQALSLDPQNAYAAYFAGSIEQFRSRHEAALPHLQRAVQAAAHGFAWLGLGAVHLSLGNLAEALWCGERAVALEQQPGFGPTAGAGSLVGECHRLSGRLEEARTASAAAVEAAERSDHMYRDTFRAVALCCLGRTALMQRDHPAAAAAFNQVTAHVSGRPRTLGGGFLRVQALAGLAITRGPGPFDEALALFERRDRYNFSVAWGCGPDACLADLARAATALGRPDARTLLERARDAGSHEARLVLANALTW